MSSPGLFYTEKINSLKTLLNQLQKKINWLGIFRMIFFLLLAVALYFYFKEFNTLFFLASLFLLITFSWLVKTSLDLKENRALNEKLLFINTNEFDVVNDKPNNFPTGEQWISGLGNSDDLDIFGKGSVFQLLNRTTTSHGQTLLSSFLMQPTESIPSIENYQQAIKVMANQTEKRQLLIAHGLLNEEKEGNLNSVSEWLKQPGKITASKWLKFVRLVIPLYNFVSIYYCLDTGNYIPLIAGIISSWIIIKIFGKDIQEQSESVSKKQQALQQYAAILKVFNTVDKCDSKELEQLQSVSANAFHAMKKLSQLSSFFDQRLNLLVNIFFNSIFMYDIQCMIGLEHWKKKYAPEFDSWIDCVGKIEYLNSLSTFAFNNPAYTYAVFSADKLIIETKQMAHPLIPSSERIGNDFVIGKNEKLQLITGSNMSGKTTFLRTIGVNLILAQCGAPVCAEYFHCSIMQVLTSLRVSDSLQEHTSYFMAELKKLKQIISQLSNRKNSLVLIDEILRGTNSEDKTHGSEMFIRKLLTYDCLTLFATHDLSLHTLADEFPQTVSNYCFESIIKEDELKFDYRLRAGVAKNKNASFLMKQMDII